MKLFYADDTYAKSGKDDKSSKINLFGGFIISKSDEKRLMEIIREVKSRYTHPNLPMKWNFKDTVVKDKFEAFGRLEEYTKMLADSNSWRRDIIKLSLELDYKIICGIIENYSNDPKVIKKSKLDLLKYSFENLLMRLGLDAKDSDYETYIVLDWPPDGNPQPFVQAYYRLFHQGKSSAGTSIKSGRLSECNFFHTLLFAKCNHSPLLQFSDLIVGSLKDFIESKLSNRQNLFASEIFDLYKSKIRSSGGKIIGYGIIPPTGNSTFRAKLKNVIE